MSSDQRYRDHERLMQRLADANGVDLDLMTQSGTLSPETYEDAVLNCVGCSDPEGCNARVAGGQSDIPAFCRNRDQMVRWSEVTPSSD